MEVCLNAFNKDHMTKCFCRYPVFCAKRLMKPLAFMSFFLLASEPYNLVQLEFV